MSEEWYLAIDPGGSYKRASTGIAEFDSEGEVLKVHEVTFKQLEAYLLDLENRSMPRALVLEQYRIRPGVNTGSSVPTIEMIGIIKAFCRKWRIPIVLQEPKILPVAEKWAGVKRDKSKHLEDWKSAYLHGVYYLTKKGIRRPRVLDSNE